MENIISSVQRFLSSDPPPAMAFLEGLKAYVGKCPPPVHSTSWIPPSGRNRDSSGTRPHAAGSFTSQPGAVRRVGVQRRATLDALAHAARVVGQPRAWDRAGARFSDLGEGLP